MKQSMYSLLTPHQLGFGVPFGAETLTHNAHNYLHNLKPGNIILKLISKMLVTLFVVTRCYLQ